ncbi:hypothetical protein Tco_0065830 [Tanacetum coccineum]
MQLAQAQEARVSLDEEQIAFLEDKGERVDSDPAAQALTTNVIFQTYSIDAFDSDVDEAPTESAAFMANLSDYGSNVLSEVPNYNTYHDNIVFEHNVQEMQYSEQPVIDDDSNIEITSDSNVISYVKKHDALSVIDTEETLILAEESRIKMLEKQNDPIVKEKRVDITLIDYTALNGLYEHFVKHFVPKNNYVMCTSMHADFEHNYVLPANDNNLVYAELEKSYIDEYNNVLELEAELECMTRSSTKKLFTPLEEPDRVLHSTRKLFKTSSLDYSSSPEFDLFSYLKNQSEEEVTEEMTEPTMDEYMTITRKDYDSGINEKGRIELKGRFLLELSDNSFSGTNREDAVEHVEIFMKIVDLLNIPNVTHGRLRIETNGFNIKVEWDPTNIEFESWLASKFKNHKTMDRYTKNALWDYWRRGDDEEEFNYLSQIDVDVFIIDLPGFKTYEEYKDDWIYEWNDGIPWVNEKPWTDDGKEDGYCNTGDLPGFIREGNSIRYEDYEWYATIEDSELKEEALNNKAILEKSMNIEGESSDDAWSHCSPIENGRIMSILLTLKPVPFLIKTLTITFVK